MCFNIVRRKYVLVSSSGPIKFNITLLLENVTDGTGNISMLLYDSLCIQNTIVMAMLPADYVHCSIHA